MLVHQFRNRSPREFFHAPSPKGRTIGKQAQLREQVIALRKQNLSVHDISRALATEGESLSPAAIAVILKQEGFAKGPRNNKLCKLSFIRLPKSAMTAACRTRR